MAGPIEPQSPCVQLCHLDPGTNLCIGCCRSIEEISAWASYTAEQKRSVLRELDQRRDKYRLDASVLPPRIVCERMPEATRCEQCGAEFTCGTKEADGHCWCAQVPNVMPLTSPADKCLCPACLGVALQERLNSTSSSLE